LKGIMGESKSKIPVRVGGNKSGVSSLVRLAEPVSPTSSLSSKR